MKKWILVLALLAGYQQWDRIERALGIQPYAGVAQQDVALYATAWCGYCQKTREFFAAQGIPYIEHDIEKSEQARLEYNALQGRGVPVVNVRGTVVHGYAPQEILAALD